MLLLSSSVRTQGAGIGSFSSMRTNVSPQVLFGDGAVLAQMTSERFLSGVFQDVALQVTRIGSNVRTEAALLQTSSLAVGGFGSQAIGHVRALPVCRSRSVLKVREECLHRSQLLYGQ